MNVSSALSAVNSGNALQQAIGLKLLSQVKDSAAAQTSVLLQDFAQSQKQIASAVAPHLGQTIDIRL